MKILIAHNSYQRPGGEDVVFNAESALLEAFGHEVVRYTADNRNIGETNRLTLAMNSIWNGGMVREVRNLIQGTRPDVMHVHNTMPLISPAIYHAAHAEGVPVVQTLHNFRLLCPRADLLRDGKICEDCVGAPIAWPGIVHGCYRGSRIATGVVAATITAHSLLGTWREKVDRYIAMSEFMRQKYIEGGWPADRISVKPNFFDDVLRTNRPRGGYVLYVGRLSAEKGIQTLLRALGRMTAPPRLKIAGDGPLMPADRDADPRIEWLGHQPREHLVELMRGASVLVFPSECYEGCPLAIIEAFATGLPVIASRLGNMAEMVRDGVTGLLFQPSDPEDLARVLISALSHPADTEALAVRGRQEFEQKYTPERNYHALMAVYRSVVKRGSDNGSTNRDEDEPMSGQFDPQHLRTGTGTR